MSITERQESIVIGSLLGDGAMRCKRNALLEINHSRTQSSYVDWKYAELKPLVGTPPRARRSNGDRVAYRFTTFSLEELTPFYRAFYQGGRKRVPEVTISPLALAVWFMDDGSRSRSSIYLNTQQFEEPDQLRLLRCLFVQHDLAATLNSDKRYTRIRLRTASMSAFKRVIAPYLLPQFAYKLP